MSDIKSSDLVIPQPAVSSLSGNAASYASNEVTPVTGVKGGKRRGKKTAKKRRSAKRKSEKKCWWKFF